MATGRIGVTPTLRTRWSDQPTAGTTSLSGLDDNSVALVYDVGYEAVYRNGVLLSRGNDYTATNGTTVTLVDATLAGDIIEIFANQLVPLTDAISKGQYTAKGALLSATAASTPGVLAVGTNGQVLKADSSTATGLVWGSASSAFSGAAGEMTSSTTVPSGTKTVILFGGELFDTDGYHSTSSNTGRFTIPTGKDGYFLITALVGVQNSTSGSYQEFSIDKNGSSVAKTQVKPPRVGSANDVFIAGVFAAVATDYFELTFVQNSGGDLSVSGQSGAEFTISYLGA